jgi:hypothetical protein
MLNGLASILLASLWDVATDRIEEIRPPPLVVDEVVWEPALLLAAVTPVMVAAALPVGEGWPSYGLCLVY